MSQISKEADYLKEAKLFLYISSSLLEYQQVIYIL